jgi:hypothetical protein
MSTLRQLFEEALTEKIGSFDNNLANVQGYQKTLIKGGQWHGAPLAADGKHQGKRTPNPYHDELGKFSQKDDATSMSWGRGLRKAKMDGGEPSDTSKKAGRTSGSGKIYTSNKTKGYRAVAWAKGPSPDRVLARTGKTRANSLPMASPSAAKKHLLNLIKGKGKVNIKAARKAKAAAAGAGGRKAKKSAQAAAAYNPAFAEASELFMARLMEGAETHPLEHVDYARNAIQEALQALISMPDAEDYDEIVESAEALAEIDEFLDYSDEG